MKRAPGLAARAVMDEREALQGEGHEKAPASAMPSAPTKPSILAIARAATRISPADRGMRVAGIEGQGRGSRFETWTMRAAAQR